MQTFSDLTQSRLPLLLLILTRNSCFSGAYWKCMKTVHNKETNFSYSDNYEHAANGTHAQALFTNIYTLYNLLQQLTVVLSQELMRWLRFIARLLYCTRQPHNNIVNDLNKNIFFIYTNFLCQSVHNMKRKLIIIQWFANENDF